MISEAPRQIRLVGDLRRSVNFARSLQHIIDVEGSGQIEVCMRGVESKVDEDLVAAIKGIGAGIYQEMKNGGGEIIARNIMFEEGVEQIITREQRAVLTAHDRKWVYGKL